MKSKKRHLGFIAVLCLAAALVLVPGFTRQAQAASEDVAMFYDDLGQLGQWFEYENYGPVWHPGNVDENWRPYTNGRWVPTNDGYVFESEEPWGWATYHYGNWMPTEGYGWVWVPGATWYPSTVEWRTSPEEAPVDTSYVGWAPIPPPNYAPPPSYAPVGYAPGAPMGYGPGANLITEPFWIFAQAASFLLGLGQPYTPQYSYGGCGCLAPPTYVPTFFPQTVIVPTYMTPTYYPAGFLGGAVIGAYAWGPPTGYISRVTNINQTVINNTIINNSAHLTNIHNVRPPQHIYDRNRHLRDIMPPDLVRGTRLPPPHPVSDIRTAQANLGKPNVVRTPKGVGPVNANIPKVQPVSHTPGKGIPGAGLPQGASQKLTPQMESKIKQVPPNRQITPTKAIKPTLTTGGAQPGVTGRTGQVQPGVTGRPGQFQPGVTGRTVQPGVTGRTGQVQPGVTGRTVQPGFTGRTVQPGVTGTTGQVQPGVTGRPGQFQPGVTGRTGQVQPGVTGRTVQPGVTGRTVQPGVTGRTGQVQPGVTGRTVQPGVTGRTVQPGVTGRTVQPGVTGRTVQPGVTGRTVQPGVTGRTVQPGGTGRTVQPGGTGRTVKPGVTGRTGAPAATGKAVSPAAPTPKRGQTSAPQPQSKGQPEKKKPPEQH